MVLADFLMNPGLETYRAFASLVYTRSNKTRVISVGKRANGGNLKACQTCLIFTQIRQ